MHQWNLIAEFLVLCIIWNHLYSILEYLLFFKIQYIRFFSLLYLSSYIVCLH